MIARGRVQNGKNEKSNAGGDQDCVKHGGSVFFRFVARNPSLLTVRQRMVGRTRAALVPSAEKFRAALRGWTLWSYKFHINSGTFRSFVLHCAIALTHLCRPNFRVSSSRPVTRRRKSLSRLLCRSRGEMKRIAQNAAKMAIKTTPTIIMNCNNTDRKSVV